MNILVAEDDRPSALILQRSLEKMGHPVTTANNGEEAWRLLQEENYELIISDWMMPEMDGLELCRRVRSRKNVKPAYFILLTARELDRDKEEGLESGADDFLIKPIDNGDLAARIDVAQRIISMQEELIQQSNILGSARTGLSQQAAPLGEILVSQEYITREQLQWALERQSSMGERLGSILINNGWATEEQVTYARSIQMDVPYVAIANEMPDPFAIAQVPFEIANQNQLLPISLISDDRDGSERLRVAMVNPWDVEAIDLLQRHTRRRIEPILASKTALVNAIETAYHDKQGMSNDAFMSDTISKGNLDIVASKEFEEDFDVDETIRQSDQAPVIRFVDTLFHDAIVRNASDIHIEPRKKDFQIRYRIDGQLQVIRTVPRKFLAPTTSRIKIMAEMDIAERRLPLDGRVALKMEGRSVDLRVSTLPTQYGERVVMRLLDRSNALLGLDDLGFSVQNSRAFQKLIHKQHGMILVTGPTGSGKTTTLYAALNAIKSPMTNIITCEDPIEYELEGISQSNVNERAGLTFARQLRSVLRQDPDVILVGEIRDGETAEIASRAALTGHLVLSTLHCNEAAGAVSRLLDMGVASFLLASTVVGVVAQRLVRRLCPHCKIECEVSPERIRLYEEMGGIVDNDLRFYQSEGCVHCDRTGTKGRAAVHEVLVIDNEVRRLIMEKSETEMIRRAALSRGMAPLASDAITKVRLGFVSIEDAYQKVGAVSDDNLG